jgi:hypothetical protein
MLLVWPFTRNQLNSTQRMLSHTPIALRWTPKSMFHRRRRRYQSRRRRTACSWTEELPANAPARQKHHTSSSIKKTTSHHHPCEGLCRHDVRITATVKPTNSARLRPQPPARGALRTRVPTVATHPSHPRRACATSVPLRMRPRLLSLQPTPSSPSTAHRRRRRRLQPVQRRYTRDLVGRRR